MCTLSITGQVAFVIHLDVCVADCPTPNILRGTVCSCAPRTQLIKALRSSRMHGLHGSKDGAHTHVGSIHKCWVPTNLVSGDALELLNGSFHEELGVLGQAASRFCLLRQVADHLVQIQRARRRQVLHEQRGFNPKLTA